MTYRHLLVATFSLLLSAMAASSVRAQASILVSDGLSLKDHPDQIAGNTLDGVPVQKGAGAWVVPTAHPPYINEPWNFSENGLGTVFSSGGTSVSWSLDSPPSEPTGANAEIPSLAGKVTVQAEMLIGSSGWGGVTLLNTPQSIVFTPGSLLLATIDQKGIWRLYRDHGATQTTLASGDLDNYSPSNFITLGLQYDTKTGKASLFVNGKDLSGPVDAEIDSSTQIGAAGFYFYGPKSDIEVKNFQVSLDPSR